MVTNSELKNIKKLKDKKYRREQGLFLVEGIKSCEELKKSNYKIVKTLSTSQKDYPNFELVDELTIKQIATTETPQNIICVVELPKKQDALPKGNSLILDSLQDPGNVGTLIRSASAFNFLDVYLINSVDVFSEKVIRSSMGTIFKVNIHEVDENYIITNKKQICDILVGTDMKSTSINELEKSKKLAVIIGNEGNGVSKNLLKHTDINVTLEMNKNVESLNAGVAGSILMYEIFKD